MKSSGRNRIQAFSPEEFPGYPRYSPNEDIMKQAKRVEVGLDDGILPVEALQPVAPAKEEQAPVQEEDEDKNDTSESDVTKEDLEALGPEDLSLDMNDDEQLKHRTTPVDFAGEDLDIPGSELDDAQESIGTEDEENNGYSIGGDNHDDLEEAKP